MAPSRLLVAVFTLSLVCGFGVGHLLPEEGSVSAATTAVAPAPSPVEDGTHRVVLAGDSVMAGLVPAVEAALGGAVEVEFIVTPAILRDPSVRFTWSQELEAIDPDVVVMLVGTWEERAVPDGLETDGTTTTVDEAWTRAYRDEVVEPWLELVTSTGAEVLWIGAPPVEDDQLAGFFHQINAVFAALPAAHPEVRFLDPADALGPAGDGFLDVLRLPDGSAVRLRQVDGLHLCPAGAALLGADVADALAADLGVAVTGGWEQGPWREDAQVFPAEGCPPATS